MAKQQVQQQQDGKTPTAKRIYHPAKCRGCGQPSPSVRCGKFRYHDSCLENKPRSRQRFNERTGEWERLGTWSDAEAIIRNLIPVE